MFIDSNVLVIVVFNDLFRYGLKFVSDRFCEFMCRLVFSGCGIILLCILSLFLVFSFVLICMLMGLFRLEDVFCMIMFSGLICILIGCELDWFLKLMVLLFSFSVCIVIV